jgi:hypothetical protein
LKEVTGHTIFFSERSLSEKSRFGEILLSRKEAKQVLTSDIVGAETKVLLGGEFGGL